MEAKVTAQRWTCWRCGMLLGIEREGEVEVKYKDVRYTVKGGVVSTTCRRCSAECSASNGAGAAPKPAPAP